MALPGSDEPVSIQEAEARQELLGLIIALNPDRRE
jgi:hypothetical protein